MLAVRKSRRDFERDGAVREMFDDHGEVRVRVVRREDSPEDSDREYSNRTDQANEESGVSDQPTKLVTCAHVSTCTHAGTRAAASVSRALATENGKARPRASSTHQ